MIIREIYLSRIRPFYDQDLIKVIMGIRRCGKSVLLLQIIDELKERGIDEKQIIYINFENKDNREVSRTTLYNYLEYMTKAMLINKADRYDIRGKRILNGKYKYYLTDLGLGQIKNIGKRQQLGAYLENIVYNELISRGYDVKIGNLEKAEIDFIATKFKEKIYIQVAYILADDTVIDREFGAYKNIEDNYPKYVLTMDKYDFSQDGIIHQNVIDWLLND